jgi:hydroxymethylpyrimidine/phosphomethylpyrimidine kinase
LPRAFVVTPNIPEAELLSGCQIRSVKDAHEAAKRIHGLGPTAVIVKGGHAGNDVIVDVMFDGDRISEFPTPRVQTSNVHGTGCTFASAIAAHLALGGSLSTAIEQAQIYLAGAIRQSLAVGNGQRLLNHFWLKP